MTASRRQFLKSAAATSTGALIPHSLPASPVEVDYRENVLYSCSGSLQ